MKVCTKEDQIRNEDTQQESQIFPLPKNNRIQRTMATTGGKEGR
jgi:hypothetical protein